MIDMYGQEVAVGDDGKTLYGVDHRNYTTITAEEFLQT